MDKKLIYIWLFIKSIFCISSILGFSLFYFVIIEQRGDTKIQMYYLIDGLEKNYIINVRPVYDQVQCYKNETAISALVYQNQNHNYNLDYIEIGEENQKQVIGLCYEINYSYSFIALKQQNELIKQEQSECIYKGISFKIEETSKCPISDIKFSTEEFIPNYEKIQIQNSNKLNLFLKRSDKNEVPLTDIYLSKKNFENKQINQIANTSFSMDSICKKYYNQFKKVCSIKSKPEQMKFNLFKETHLAIDCDRNAEILNYDAVIHKFISFNLIKPNDHPVYIFLIMFYLVFTFAYLKPSLDYFEDSEKERDEEKEKSLKIVQFIFILYQSALTYSYYTYQETFSYAIQLLQGISYFNEDPLKNIYEKAQVLNQLSIIIIWTPIILFLIDILIGILSISKVLKFIRLEQQEIQELN